MVNQSLCRVIVNDAKLEAQIYHVILASMLLKYRFEAIYNSELDSTPQIWRWELLIRDIKGFDDGCIGELGSYLACPDSDDSQSCTWHRRRSIQMDTLFLRRNPRS